MPENKIARRTFLRHTGLSGIALILGVAKAEKAGAIEKLPAGHAPGPTGITPYIIIDTTGKITLINPKTEIGQGTYQAIPALIAEELEIPLESATIVNSWGQEGLVDQSVGGSDSVKSSYMQLRKVGAAAREMLRTAASQEWKVPIDECLAANGAIHHKPTGRKLAYGALVATAATLDVPKDPPLKDPKDFKILGKPMPRLDIPAKVNGSAEYGIDREVPGMVYASVERCPVFGSKLVSYDDSAALKVKGVIRTVKAMRTIGKNHFEGVAVIAENYWAALKGRKALKVQWDHQGFDTFSSESYEQHLRDLAAQDGLIEHSSGDFDAAMAAAPHKLEALYETPMVAHAPMEPMNCLAHWQEDDKLDLWTSVQGADIIMDELPAVLNIDRDNITPHISFVGGGFGRRLLADFAGEAALLSKAVGKPVKCIWTREDDIQCGPFRPMTFSAMKGALTADGQPIAFQHKVIAPSISATQDAKYDKTKVDDTMTEGISKQSYEIPNMKNAYVFADIHIPLQYWRSVTSSTLAFAHECFIDEMAVAAGKDPLDFRLAMLTKDSDTKRVLIRLRELSGWDKPLPPGWGRGIAQYDFFAGLAANVVEVSAKKDGGIKVEKVISIIDLGTVVNPNTVRAQVEGAIVMALIAATKDGITFEGGKSKQSNFHNYRMLRINEMPAVEVHILAEGGTKIKGVGEPGLPPVAPALANAVFSATGKRIRRLPFVLAMLLLCCSRLLAQSYNPIIDVQHYDFQLTLDDSNDVIHGDAAITLEFKQTTAQFALDLTKKNAEGKGMTVMAVSENKKPVFFTQEAQQVVLHTSAKEGETHTYTIRYSGIPADGLVIGNNKFGSRGFFGDNWPNRAHNWLPCVDHPSDKATLDFHITAPDHYTVVANGTLVEQKSLPNHSKLTSWKESSPLSPKVMVIGVADFAVDHPGDAMGIPVWNYVYKQNQEEGFRSYAVALQILPFYISHIGPFPFEKEGNVQSKTRFGGLENASAIFYFENSVGSAGVESLMAHEIAHQWFGDAATETQWRHLWLSEGFATYMTLCYLENKYGADTLKSGLIKDRDKVIAFEKRKFTPVVDTTIKDDYMKLLNPNSYEKGGWVLHMLRRKLGSDTFWKGVSTYYTTYRNRNASSADFEKVMETVSGQDLHSFFHQWLDQPGHPHVTIAWKYDGDKKALLIDFIHKDNFEFPLEYTTDGTVHTVDIHQEKTHVELPLAEKPTTLLPDPNVNLLADFEVFGQ